MSIQVMSWVWENSPAKGSGLLLLLALADHAHDDGCGAWPSVKTLAFKTRLSERNVQYLLRELAANGLIHIEPKAGPNGANVYTVNCGGANFAPGEVGFTGVQPSAGGVNIIAPEPSLEPSIRDRFRSFFRTST